VDREGLEFKKLVMAESVRLPFHGLDLVADPLEGPVLIRIT
jgi:hypothetical protein